MYLLLLKTTLDVLLITNTSDWVHCLCPMSEAVLGLSSIWMGDLVAADTNWAGAQSAVKQERTWTEGVERFNHSWPILSAEPREIGNILKSFKIAAVLPLGGDCSCLSVKAEELWPWFGEHRAALSSGATVLNTGNDVLTVLFCRGRDH